MVFVVLVGVVVVRSCGSSRVVRPDLGPGPVRGVRLTEFRPGEGDQTCTGLAADLPVVRLVEQVDVERMTVCLGPGRRADTFPLEPFVLSAAEPDGERLLDGWAAAWSLPDRATRPGGCPALAISYPPTAITVAGVTLRPVPPMGACQPLEPALAATAEIAQAARPAS